LFPQAIGEIPPFRPPGMVSPQSKHPAAAMHSDFLNHPKNAEGLAPICCANAPARPFADPVVTE